MLRELFLPVESAKETCSNALAESHLSDRVSEQLLSEAAELSGWYDELSSSDLCSVDVSTDDPVSDCIAVPTVSCLRLRSYGTRNNKQIFLAYLNNFIIVNNKILCTLHKKLICCSETVQRFLSFPFFMEWPCPFHGQR